MKSTVAIEEVNCFRDQRGVLFEPIVGDAISAQRNVHVFVTQPGCVRGNHYHRTATEIFVVLGPALIRFREAGLLQDVAVPDGACRRFTVPPGISHAIKNVRLKPLIAVAFSTVGHDGIRQETVADSLLL